MHQTTVTSYFYTRIGNTEPLLAPKEWCRVTIRLMTAGPVAVGTQHDLFPLLSGRGLLLPVDEDVRFAVNPGTRLYIASESANRLNLITEGIPWAAELQMSIDSGLQRLQGAFRPVLQRMGLRG